MIRTINKTRQSETDFLDRLFKVDVLQFRAYGRLTQNAKRIARTGIEERMAACDRQGILFDVSIAREIIEDAVKGRAVYLEV